MLAVWLAQIGRALCAPVELPAGADASAWRTALILSDLEVVPSGSLGDRAGARMTIQGASLSIWARDIYGAEHLVNVPLPATTREREAAAALAASLVQPVSSLSISLPALPPLPSPAPRPRPAHPRPAPAPPDPVAPAPQPAPEPVAVARAPDPVLEASPPEPLAPIEPPDLPVSSVLPPLVVVREPPDALLFSWADGWFASAGPALRLRPKIRSMGSLSIAAGRSRGPWALAGGVEIVAPALLLDIDGDRRLSALDVRLMPSWRAGRIELGASLGASGRYASDERQPPPPAVLPTAGLSLSYLARISPGVSVLPCARFELDLIRSGIGYYSGELLLLSPVSASVGVSGLFGRR